MCTVLLTPGGNPTVVNKYRVRHKSVNTPLSHERLVGGLKDGGRSTHVKHFVQFYPQSLYTASQVPTTCRSWDEGVLTDLCLTGVLTDLCLTGVLTDLCLNLYININECSVSHNPHPTNFHLSLFFFRFLL